MQIRGALTFAPAFVGDRYSFAFATSGFSEMACAVVGDAVGAAHVAGVVRLCRRTVPGAADTVRTQVLVEQAELAGGTAYPVARACGQFGQSLPRPYMQFLTTCSHTNTANINTYNVILNGRLLKH